MIPEHSYGNPHKLCQAVYNEQGIFHLMLCQFVTFATGNPCMGTVKLN